MLIPYDLLHQPFTIRTHMFARELSRRGHRVEIFYRRWWKLATRPAQVHREPPQGATTHAVWFWNPKTAWRVSKAIAASDVVHFQKSLPPVPFLAVVLGRWHGRAVHQDWDDFELAFWWQAAKDAARNRGLPLLRRIQRTVKSLLAASVTGAAEWLIPKSCDTVGGASMYLRRKSIDWGCPSARVFPARVGVDAEKFSPARRDPELRRRLGLEGPTVLYAGSFDVHPELVFFVASLKEFFRLAPSAQCLVVGGGFGRQKFAALIAKDVPPGAVVMSDGLVPFEDMPRYVASADIAALPFRDTPVSRCKSSLTLLECMASGLPSVTHDVGDIGWMVGDGGEIANLNDPQDFGRRLAGLANDPDRRRTLGEKARARAIERFSWEQTVNDLEAAYRQGYDRSRS